MARIAIGKVLHMSPNLKSQLSLLTGAAQTMSAWSKVIKSYAAVPEVYKGFLKTFAGEESKSCWHLSRAHEEFRRASDEHRDERVL